MLQYSDRWPVRLFGALALLLAASAVCADSIRKDGKVLTEGDTLAKVFEVLGEPDRTVQLETRAGGGAGERLEYYDDGDAILVRISGGRVISIRRIEQ